MPAHPKDLNKTFIDQKLLVVESNGHSHILVGDIEEEKPGKIKVDLLPSYMSMGWQVKNMTSFNNSDKILVLLEKHQTI